MSDDTLLVDTPPPPAHAAAPRPVPPEVEQAVQTLRQASAGAGLLLIEAAMHAERSRWSTLDREAIQRARNEFVHGLRDLSDPSARQDLVVLLSNVQRKYVSALETALPAMVDTLEAAQLEAIQKRFDEQIRGLQLLYPEVEPRLDPRLERLEDAFALQHDFMQAEAVLPSTALHERAGLTGSNPSHTASRWRRDGKIFAVRYRGKDYYPAFQFNDQGQPYGLVKRVLAILRQDPDMSDWDIAVWFTTPSGALSGERPKSLLNTRNEEAIARLIRAAEDEVATDDGG